MAKGKEIIESQLTSIRGSTKPKKSLLLTKKTTVEIIPSGISNKNLPRTWGYRFTQKGISLTQKGQLHDSNANATVP